MASSSGNADVVVVGAGPAGLIAAERLAGAGMAVTVVERMPSVARKFLMAGRGGLNLTHSEAQDAFLDRYGEARAHLAPLIARFGPRDLTTWADGLGQATFTGSSGRVFPRAMKASPLLRAWLARLEGLGVVIRTRTTWTGWDPAGRPTFAGPDGDFTLDPSATLLALGGASWPRLGSDAAWVPLLAARGVEVSPFRPANVGFEVAWSETFRERFAGTPLKSVCLTFEGRTVRGEAMVTAYGLEGGAVYALSSSLRNALVIQGRPSLTFNVSPDVPEMILAARISAVRAGETSTNALRKAAGLSPVAIGLLREAAGKDLPADPAALARLIKAAAIPLTGVRGLDRAISSAGGIPWSALDSGLQLKAVPGVWCAGEMLDWEAPTGGYLLQACFATGMAAAESILNAKRPPAA